MTPNLDEAFFFITSEASGVTGGLSDSRYPATVGGLRSSARGIQNRSDEDQERTILRQPESCL